MSILKGLSRNRSKFTTFATLGDVNLALERDNEQAGNVSAGDWKNIKKEDMESLYLAEPLMSGGINKTCSKLVSSWLTLDDPAEDKTIDDRIAENLYNFYNTIELKSKLYKAIKDALIFGNGWLELVPEKGLQNSRTPIKPSAGIKDVVNVEPKYMLDRIYRYGKGDDEFYYIEEHKGKKIFHHSSRIIHIAWDTIGTQRFGNSVYIKAYKSMVSKLNMDWALGEIIYRFGKPFIVIKTTGASPKELQKAYEVLKKLSPRSGFAGTERHEFDILNPEAVNPDPFAKYYYINCAASLEMPFMVFMGAQKGQLTGSEIDLADWCSNLESKQEMLLTPAVNKINNYFLKGNWSGIVVWNPLLIDDKKEAEIKKIYAETIKILYNDAGLLTEIEGRQWLRNKGFDIPEDDSMFDDMPSDDESPDDFDFPLEPEENLEWVKNLSREQLAKLRETYDKKGVIH